MTCAMRAVAPAEPVEGPSFPPVVKVLAGALVGAVLVLGARASWQWSGFGWQEGGLLVAALVVMAAGGWIVLWSRTRVDAQCIDERGLWTRTVRLSEVKQLRLIVFPGLEWIVVPRLVVRASGGALAVFHAGNRELLNAFRQLVDGHHASLSSPDRPR